MLAWMLALAPQEVPKAPERVLVDRDDVVISTDAVVDFSGQPIEDDEGDGVVKIVADGVTVAFSNTALVGSKPGRTPDTFEGVAVRVTGKGVKLRGGIFQGFRAGIWASGADGLSIEGANVSGNRRHRLKSTSRAEDPSDWLWPHENDGNEWLESYGAGIYVEESRNVSISRCTAREGQNGICLRRVDDSKVFDNDMSFLSGWGLALYRSSRNVVARNSFDFCVRGYSHGVYSRGQDSAGILCFEQCCDNVFALNSGTHSGDGFFGYAGNEALEERTGVAGLGCNRNLLYGNDFSYAPAIGIEMTFSYGNRYVANRLVGSNYGVWGGYSGRTEIRDNEIAENTISGIAIEHGSKWQILRNRFASNERAIELWWDDDKDLLAKPWAKLNPTVSSAYAIEGNVFDSDKVQLELRSTTGVSWDAAQQGADASRWKVDEKSRVEEVMVVSESASTAFHDPRLDSLPGKREAVGALAHLAGRDKIIVTEWGPYDWRTPLLHRDGERDGAHAWRLLGEEIAIGVESAAPVALRMDAAKLPPLILVSPREKGSVVPYEISVRTPSRRLTGRGVLVGTTWKVTAGRWTTDPREDAAAWRVQVETGVTFEVPELALRYQSGGPSDLPGVPQAVRDAKVGGDRFGTLARTTLAIPAGRWRLTTTSDDGVRVLVDGKPVIDNWTWHVPTADSAELAFDAPATHEIAVEHFELDGYSVLELALEPVD